MRVKGSAPVGNGNVTLLITEKLTCCAFLCRDLHYAHQGGFRFELYDSDLNMVSKWDDNKHWGCSHDGTQQSIKLELPKKECEGCILRLQRQALEWGATYLFHSCALVNIVKDTNVDAACSGCSGHGTCNEVITDEKSKTC